MLVGSLVAISTKLLEFWRDANWLLLFVGGCITGISLWLIIEAGLALRKSRAGVVSELDIDIEG